MLYRQIKNNSLKQVDSDCYIKKTRGACVFFCFTLMEKKDEKTEPEFIDIDRADAF